jgi:hypothetical protein
LPKGLENAAPKLSKFIEKQYAIVSETDLTRARNIAPADERSLTDGMVRRPKRSARHDASSRVDETGHAVDGRHFNGFCEGQGRHHAREAPS